MLWNCNRIDILEDYINKKNDHQLFKWWGRYLESKNDMKEAVRYYTLAKDNASLTRIACVQNDLAIATKIALESNDPYSAYHVARKYESINNIKEAIKYYTKSSRLYNAIRLAKLQGMDLEVFNLSLLSSKTFVLQSAEYFEDKQQFERAATLYDRGGNKKKALKIAEKYKLYELVKTISKDIKETEDPEIFEKNTRFLVENKQYEKAVHLLLTAKNYEEAVDLCEQNNVPMSEELANKDRKSVV